jgi:hypothetical protein
MKREIYPLMGEKKGVTGSIHLNICIVFTIPVALQDKLYDLFSTQTSIVR